MWNYSRSIIYTFSQQNKLYSAGISFSFCFWQHGRVKIKTTAQQEEEKRKEREKKLKIYVAARDACFSKVEY